MGGYIDIDQIPGWNDEDRYIDKESLVSMLDEEEVKKDKERKVNTRKCIVCGETFEYKFSQRLTCKSDLCEKKAKNDARKRTKKE